MNVVTVGRSMPPYVPTVPDHAGLVLALGITGYMQGTDAYWGEDWVQELHGALASTLIALAGLHAVAAIVMGRIERTNLVHAMLTGVKVRPVRGRK